MQKILTTATQISKTGRHEDKLLYALVELLYATGLRISEATHLRTTDVDFKNLTLMVRDGKGGKDRVVLFTKVAADAVTDLLKGGEGWVFRGPKGKRLKSRDARKLLSDLGKQAGIPGIHPHIFRHTMATDLLDGGADIRVVQELLGHSSLKTTQKYTHTSISKLINVYNQAFPR